MSGLFIDMAGLLGALSRWRVLLVNRASLPPTVRYEILPVHSSKRDIEIDLYQANVTTLIELIACPETTFIRGSLESHDGARQIATVEVFVLLSPASDRIQVHGNVLAQ